MNNVETFCQLYNSTFLIGQADRLVPGVSRDGNAKISDDSATVIFSSPEPAWGEIVDAMVGFHSDLTALRPSVGRALADAYLNREFPGWNWANDGHSRTGSEALANALVELRGEDWWTVIPFSRFAPGLVALAIADRLDELSA